MEENAYQAAFRRLWPERHDNSPCNLPFHEGLTWGEVTRRNLRSNLKAQKGIRDWPYKHLTLAEYEVVMQQRKEATNAA